MAARRVLCLAFVPLTIQGTHPSRLLEPHNEASPHHFANGILGGYSYLLDAETTFEGVFRSFVLCLKNRSGDAVYHPFVRGMAQRLSSFPLLILALTALAAPSAV